MLPALKETRVYYYFFCFFLKRQFTICLHVFFSSWILLLHTLQLPNCQPVCWCRRVKPLPQSHLSSAPKHLQPNWHQHLLPALLGKHIRAKEISRNFLTAGRFYQCLSERKIAAFPVYKYMWENPLKLPPTFHIFLFGLVSKIKANGGSLARQPGCSLHPKGRQKLLDGIACHLLSQLSTHKPKE